jgi:hypothetical protein
MTTTSSAYSIFLGANLVLFLPLSLLWCCMPFIPTSMRSKPTAATQQNNNYALKRGYPLLAVRFMMAYQHLTIWTMLLTTLYLSLSLLEEMGVAGLPRGVRCAARQVLPAAGPIVAQFWTFVLTLGPWTLVDRRDFPKSEKKAMELVEKLFYRPTLSPACAFLALMHLQHTWMPALPFVEAFFFFDENHAACSPGVVGLAHHIGLAAAYLLSWLAWALFCWRARNSPPYPILRTVWLNGTWLLLYLGMAGLGMLGIVGYRNLLVSLLARRIY